MIALTTAQVAALLAQAAPGPQPQGGGSSMMIMMVLMMVMFYFLLIRPQRQKQKETENLQKAIQAGDEVVTIGGAHGVVTSVRENTITIRVAEGKIEFDRSAVARRVAKTVEATVEK
jgi:preprotein translocase subunit YajC